MQQAKKLLAKIMVLALMLAYIPAPVANVNAANNISTKKYTISKKTGTYSDAFKLTIKAKKGYNVYYTTGSNLTTKKVIKSGKKKTLTIKKTTTLKVYAVKKSASVTAKKLKSNSVKNKTKSYVYTISNSDSTTTDTSTTTTPGTTTDDADSTSVDLTNLDKIDVEGISYVTAETKEDAEGNTTVTELAVPQLQITKAGNYTLSGEVTNTEIVNSAKDTVTLTLDGVTIDNSGSASGNAVITDSSTNGLNIVLSGENIITGPDSNNGASVSSAVIYSDNKKETITITGNGSLTVNDGDDKDVEYSSDPSDGIATKGALVISTTGTITVNSNGDCLKGTNGGVTVLDGTLNLTSNQGDGIKSKSKYVTISGGTVNCNYTAGDGINSKNGTVYITDGEVNVGNCYGDGIQAEDVVITDGDITIATTYEYANTNFYTTNAVSGSSYNYINEDNSSSTKTETVNYDTGSHKGIKAGTKAKTEIYTTVEEGSEITAGAENVSEASGGITITGGNITIDTTATGIKANGTVMANGTKQATVSALNGSAGDTKTIIGSPEDGIHSNNTLNITGGTITVRAADDGLTAVNELNILDSANITVETAYEGIEAGTIVIGKSTDSTAEPVVSVKSNDDGVNAAKKANLVYTYEDETEEKYTKVSSATAGNTFTVTAGEITIKIDDTDTHSVSLKNSSDESATTYSFSADGDAVDCNGSFYALGGEILVVGGTSGGNSAIDFDTSFEIGEGVELFAIGTADMTEGISSAAQAYIEYGSRSTGGMGMGMNMNGGSSSSTISKGSEIKITDSDGNAIYTYPAEKNASYILYSSSDLVSGNSYTITAGSQSLGELTATTEASTSASGGMGGPGGNPPSGGNGPSGGNPFSGGNSSSGSTPPTPPNN